MLATAIGWTVGTVAATVAAGAVRPLAPLLGGLVIVALYGAVIGAAIGVAQAAAFPRRTPRLRDWIVSTTVGGVAGFTLASLVGETLGNAIDPLLNVVVGEGIIEDTSGAVLGLCIAAAQLIGARRLAGRGRAWIPATAIAAGLGYGTAGALLEIVDVEVLRIAPIVSFGVILGLFVAVAQALVLAAPEAVPA